jgi:hypothetical protein
MEKKYAITHEQFLEGKRLIASNGGFVYDDGSFEIKGVKGKFLKIEGYITIKVTKKPLLATWKTIENKLDEFFT